MIYIWIVMEWVIIFFHNMVLQCLLNLIELNPEKFASSKAELGAMEKAGIL